MYQRKFHILWGGSKVLEAQNSKSLKAAIISDAWLGQLPSGRRLQGVMPIITNHDFGFAHYGPAEPRHPEPGHPGSLMSP